MEANDKRRQRGAATREQLVEAALELVARDGVAGVTASALADAAGVSKATIFHHFSQLQDVTAQAMELLFTRLMATARVEGDGATAYLVGLGIRSMQALELQPGWVAAAQAFMVAGLHDPELRERMAHASREARAQVAEDLHRLAPDTPIDTLSEIADVAIASLDGMGLHVLLTGDRDAFEAAWRHLANQLAEGLVEHPPARGGPALSSSAH